MFESECVRPPVGPMLLENFDVFTRLREDFARGRFPWVGRFEDFCLGYLTFASILHADVDSVSRPVGSFVIGNTATGKTQFLEALCKLFPRERIINLTTASTRSLIYECRQNPYYLNGKIVFVEELSGIKNQEIQYLLRVLLTKGYAVHNTVLSGQAENIEIFGAISLQSTGLNSDLLRDDTMNRLVIFESDHSEERTSEVLGHIIDRYSHRSLAVQDSYTEYLDFFQSLRAKPVIVPYGERIKFDARSFATRRSSKIFMDLLATVALLRQHQRKNEGGVVISEPEDFEFLVSITTKRHSFHELKLTSSQRTILNVTQRVADTRRFSYSDVLAQSPCGENRKPYTLASVKKALLSLRELGIVDVTENSRPAYFRLKEAENSFQILPS